MPLIFLGQVKVEKLHISVVDKLNVRLKYSASQAQRLNTFLNIEWQFCHVITDTFSQIHT